MAARQGGWRRDHAKEERWRRALREWRRSGLSVREFCDWQNLSEPSFYAWRREIGKRDRENAAASRARAANGNRRLASQSVTKAGAPAFVPVQVIAEVSGAPRHGECLQVQLPSGAQLRVPAGFERQTIIDVIAA